MPTYLRWIAAITSAVTVYFAYSMVTLGVVKASGRDQLLGGGAALVSLGAFLVTLVVALAVSDWLARRYPLGSKVPDMGAGLRPGEREEQPGGEPRT